MAQKPQTFVRTASGLVREFSLRDAFIFNVCIIAPGMGLSTSVFASAFLFPGGDLTIGIIIGAIMSIFAALTYGLLAAAMPRSGGDYIYISRILHPALGFMGNWTFTWWSAMGIAWYFLATINTALSASLATYGIITNNAGLVTLGSLLATPNYTFALASILLWITCAIMALGPRSLRIIMIILFIPAILGSFVTIAVLATSSPEGFIASFNSLLSAHTGIEDTYHHIINQAQSLGYGFPKADLGATIMTLPETYWMFLGFTYSAYLSGEIKEVSKSQPVSITAALLFGAFCIYAPTVALFYRVVGWDFIGAVSYLFFQHPEAYVLPVPAVLNFFVGITTLNPVANILVSASFVSWIYVLALTLAMVPTRNMFAWAFDRLIPEKFAEVNDKYHSPIIATVTVCLVTWLMMALYNYTTIFTPIANYMMGLSVVFFLAGVAAMVFPFTKKDLFEASPKIVQSKIGGVPVISICGAVTAALFALIFVFALMTPAFSGPTGPQAWAFFIIMMVIPIVLFYAVRAYRRRQGIDMDLLFKEVPP